MQELKNLLEGKSIKDIRLTGSNEMVIHTDEHEIHVYQDLSEDWCCDSKKRNDRRVNEEPTIMISGFCKWTITYLDLDDCTQVIECDSYEETKDEVDTLIDLGHTRDAIVVYPPHSNLTKEDFDNWDEDVKTILKEID
jgi:hypothetical protein